MSNLDQIFLNELYFQSLIGVYEYERVGPTQLRADIVLHADLSQAAHSDSLEDTIDYAMVAQKVAQVGANHQFQLLEALGGKIIEAIFDHFPVQKIELTLSKSNIVENCQSVGIRVVQERSS